MDTNEYHNISISQWPVKERPRERLIEHGASSLSNAELIAIILRTGSKSVSAVDLAIALLKRFKNLQGINSASIKELADVKGLGYTKATMLKATFELGKRLMSEVPDNKVTFSAPEVVFDYISPYLKHQKNESFFCFALDPNNRLLSSKEIFIGTLTKSIIHPREIFAYAIKEYAAGIILVHNHPSGNPEPSPDDIKVSKQIKDAGDVIGIPLVDHIIIGDKSFHSMKRSGYI